MGGCHSFRYCLKPGLSENFTFALYTPKDNTNFQKKNSFCLKDQSLPISKVESFSKLRFDLNQTCGVVLKQNNYIWNFNTNELLYSLNKDLRKALKL